MAVLKNDMVMIVSGNDRGKTGKVLKVFPSSSRVIVEGVNIRKRHTKPTQQNRQGGIIEKEMSIHVSNVMLLDPKTNEPVRAGWKPIDDEKTGKTKHVRISRKSNEMFQ